jgi:hypothetical protein
MILFYVNKNKAYMSLAYVTRIASAVLISIDITIFLSIIRNSLAKHWVFLNGGVDGGGVQFKMFP